MTKKEALQKCIKEDSPFSNYLNGEILTLSPEETKVVFQIKEHMKNALGYVHGGCLAAITDDVIGMVPFATENKNLHVTTHLYLDYIANTKLDQVYAVAKIVKQGMSLSNISCKIYDAEDKLLIDAKANAMKVYKKLDLN